MRFAFRKHLSNIALLKLFNIRMRKLHTFTLLLALTGITLLSSCSKKTDDPTIRDFIKKSWKASKVTQIITTPPATVGGTPTVVTTVIYDPAATPPNKQEDHTSEILKFIDGTNYQHTDFKGNTTTGTYAFTSDDTAILFTGGGLDKYVFNIVTPVSNNLTDTVFNISYSETYIKTGPRTLQINYVPA